MYGATEGMIGQQLDEKPYWSPNYDGFLFEVQTGRCVKMLHEMRRGERGSLIVSTSVLPRYRIGDLILAFGDSYLRCIGRERPCSLPLLVSDCSVRAPLLVTNHRPS